MVLVASWASSRLLISRNSVVWGRRSWLTISSLSSDDLIEMRGAMAERDKLANQINLRSGANCFRRYFARVKVARVRYHLSKSHARLPVRGKHSNLSRYRPVLLDPCCPSVFKPLDPYLYPYLLYDRSSPPNIMIDHLFGRPNPSWKRTQVSAYLSLWLS